MSDTAVHIENLGKKYSLGQQNNFARSIRNVFSAKQKKLSADSKMDFWAIRNINIQIERGEVVGIIGPNGAGKSTLLKILSNIVTPTEGRAVIHGRTGSLLEVGTGFHPELTGRENIYLNGAILGMKKAEIDRQFEPIVEFSGIGKFLDTPIKRYSSGMGVRLGFAVAAHLQPEILIVDEVLSVGDAEFQKKCIGKMTHISGEGRTVLFVSHNMTAVKSLCSRVFLLQNGQIADEGKPREVISKYLGSRDCLLANSWTKEQAPQNEFLRMRSAKIILRGKSDSVIDVKTDIVMEFEFENFLEDAEMNFSLHLSTAEGAPVFNTVSEPQKYPRGIVRGSCLIPRDLLNDEKYTAMLMIVKDQSKALLTVEDILTFEVEEIKRSGGWMGKWFGVVRPTLEWKTAHTAEDK